MKLPIRLSAQTIALLLLSTPVWADTTVTTSGDTVTVAQTPNQTTQVVIQPVAPQVVVLQSQPVIIMEQRDPRRLEGRINKISLSTKELTVHDINGRDRRVLLMKPSMINKYKMGDYVNIYLTSDLQEALSVRTQQVPDLNPNLQEAQIIRIQ